MIQTEQIQNIYWKWLVHDGEPDLLLEKRVWIEGHSLKDILDDLDILKNHATTIDEYDSIPDVIKLRKMLPSRECFIDALMELARRHIIHGRLTSDHIIVDINDQPGNPHFGEPQINIISWNHCWDMKAISFSRFWKHKRLSINDAMQNWIFIDVYHTFPWLDVNALTQIFSRLQYEKISKIEMDQYFETLNCDGECQF